MLSTLHHHHIRSICSALVAVVLLSLLQLCLMPAAESQEVHALSHPPEHSMADAMADNCKEVVVDSCCMGGAVMQLANMDTVCPDCEDSEAALQVPSSDLEPVFILLYRVTPGTFDQSPAARSWLIDTEPDILSSRPEIYLAKASFLE